MVTKSFGNLQVAKLGPIRVKVKVVNYGNSNHEVGYPINNHSRNLSGT